MSRAHTPSCHVLSSAGRYHRRRLLGDGGTRARGRLHGALLRSGRHHDLDEETEVQVLRLQVHVGARGGGVGLHLLRFHHSQHPHVRLRPLLALQLPEQQGQLGRRGRRAAHLHAEGGPLVLYDVTHATRSVSVTRRQISLALKEGLWFCMTSLTPQAQCL